MFHAPAFPPRRGVQVRNSALMGNLGEGWEVESYSLTIQRSDLPLPRRRYPAGPRWTDHRSRDPLMLVWTRALARLGYPPVFAHRLARAWPHRQVVRALSRADAVIVSPPYHYEWVRAMVPAGVPVVFDEHSVEADMYTARGSRWSKAIVREIQRSERAALGGADTVFVTSPDDGARVRAEGAREVVVVPNGAEVARFAPDNRDTLDLRRQLGLPTDRPLGIFVGSGHPPNVAAVAELERQADEYDRAGLTVVIAGRCGLGRAPVWNVVHCGEVPDVATYLHAADVALCPLTYGSGTSLKTVEYLAAGLPLVSTAVGVRGLGLAAGVDCEVAAISEMPTRVAALLGDPARMAALRAAGRAAAARFDWTVIGATAATALDRLVDRKRADAAPQGAAPPG